MNNKLKFVLLGFIIFVIGCICFSLELKSFDIKDGLTPNFNIKQKILNYKITSNQIFTITNTKGNDNINLYIDNNLSDEVKIVVSYPEISDLKYDYSSNNNGNINLVNINFESEITLDFSNIKDIYRLGIVSFKDKVIYNYSLLEKPKIKIFVNEKYRKNIQFVGNYGKVYNPIR